jgi:hypothetical protein
MIERALLAGLVEQGDPVSTACLEWLLSGVISGGDDRGPDFGWPVTAAPM